MCLLSQTRQVARFEQVRAALNDGMDPNIKTRQGRTALMIAAREGYPKFVRPLPDAGADANARDDNGETALTWSA